MLARVILVWGVACSAPSANRPGAADADEDGVPDHIDQCPREQEDYDGHRDGDGCPDFDESSHEILDVDDRCPIILDCDEEFVDFDGCPDVVLSFAPGSATLTDEHGELVDELAVELEGRKRVKRLRVDGYSAADEAELLAGERAQAVVDRLVARGIAATMLELGPTYDRARAGASAPELELGPTYDRARADASAPEFELGPTYDRARADASAPELERSEERAPGGERGYVAFFALECAP